MINNVSPSAGAQPAATDASQTASGGKTVYHTPFGDVMVDTLATPDTPAGTGRPAIPPVVVHAALAASNPAPAPAAPTPAAPATPTLESKFGNQPYLEKPAGTGPLGSYDFNPIYFATKSTADTVAQLVGGTVVEQNDMVTGGPFSQSAPNEMIQFADGRQVNAGIVANFFNHGYSQSYIDTLLKQVANGSNT
jgi:hypothetical protein